MSESLDAPTLSPSTEEIEKARKAAFSNPGVLALAFSHALSAVHDLKEQEPENAGMASAEFEDIFWLRMAITAALSGKEPETMSIEDLHRGEDWMLAHWEGWDSDG